MNMTPWRCLLGLHSWLTLRYKGGYRYRECRLCCARRANRSYEGCESPDRSWLAGGEFQDAGSESDWSEVNRMLDKIRKAVSGRPD